MYWSLFIVFYAATALQQCRMAPAQSEVIIVNNVTIFIAQQPMPCDMCTVYIDSVTGAIYESQANCSSGAAYFNIYSGSKVGCQGLPYKTFPVNLNGGNIATIPCSTMNIAYYPTTNCSGPSVYNIVNEIWPWETNGCMYNKTMSCVNRQPMVKFYNNTACSGNATVVVAGQCSPAWCGPVEHGVDLCNLGGIQYQSMLVTATYNQCQ